MRHPICKPGEFPLAAAAIFISFFISLKRNEYELYFVYSLKISFSPSKFRLNEISVLSISFYSVLAAEDLAEPLCCSLADGLLDMEVMPGHIQIGMADDGLDRG